MPQQTPILNALKTSLIVNRIDSPSQISWTEWRTGLVLVGGTPAQAGDLALLGPNGQFDPSVIPTTGSSVSVNGNPVANPNFNNTTPAAPVGFTNVIWQFDGSGNVSAYYATSGAMVSFGQITTGTNTAATMTVDSGASIVTSGTGVVEATELATNTATPVVVNSSAPTHEGMLLISQPGNASAAWADPLVQGLYADGSNIATPPPFALPTTIQPVLIGGKGADGLLHSISTDNSGVLNVNAVQTTSPWVVSGTVSVSNFPASVAVTQSTSPWVVSGSVSVSNFPADQVVHFTSAQHVIVDSGAIAVTQSTSPWVVSGTVAVTQSTSPWATQDAADGPVTPGTAAANSILGGAVYNAVAPAPTTGQQLALQADSAGNLRTVPNISTQTLTVWDSSTPLNSTQTLLSNSGAAAVVIQLNQTSTITAGAVTFEGSFDSTNWSVIPTTQVLDPNTFAQLTNPYTLTASTKQPFTILTQGYQQIRVRLSTAIVGTGTVTPFLTLLPYPPVIAVDGTITASGTITANIGTTGGLALDATVSIPLTPIGFTATTDPVELVAIAGKTTSVLRAAHYMPIPLATQGNAVLVKHADTQRDAFDRIRTSHPINLFDNKFEYDLSPLTFTTSVSGAGTVTSDTAHSSAILSVGTASGDLAILQSKKYIRYQPGKSQLTMMTGIMGGLKANVTQRIGYLDDGNGVFFQQDGTNLAVVTRSNTSGSPVDTVVTQANWNLDKLNGTGPSGVTVDTSKSQVYTIDFQWLGSGRIRWGLFFNGIPVYVHEFPATNSLATGPYMRTATLPLRYELRNTGTSASPTTLLATCQSVSSEGGLEFPPALQFTASNKITAISVSTRRPVLSISPKTTFNSVTNRSTIIFDDLHVLASSGTVYWELVYNGTLTGAAFASVDSNSTMNFDVTATAISGGTVVDSGFASGGGDTARSLTSSSLNDVLPLTLDVGGTVPDTLTLVATAFTGSVLVNGALVWREPR